MKENIVLLFGGKSHEHAISTVSAWAVYTALATCGYQVLCIAVTNDQTWYLQDPPHSRYLATAGSDAFEIMESEEHRITIAPGKGLFRGGKAVPAAYIFPVMHGAYGEDGRIQALLDMLPYPYFGTDSLVSATCFHKSVAKAVMFQAGIPVAPWFVINNLYAAAEDSAIDPLARDADRRIVKEFGYPVFVKPENSGSSIGISCVESSTELSAALQEVSSLSDVALIEQQISGREIEFGIVGYPGSYQVTPPGEIIPCNRFYDFNAKYREERDRNRLIIPAELPSAVLAAGTALVVRICTLIGLCGYARVDLFFHDATRQFYCNEINTIPGFTPTSMFMKLVQQAGLSWEVLTELLKSAAEFNFRKKSRLEQLPGSSYLLDEMISWQNR